MPADGAREFVDTNVFVYAYDASSGEKGVKARALLSRLWESGQGCVSLQVLTELFVTLTRKVPSPLGSREAARIVEGLSAWRLHEPDRQDLLAAIEIHTSSRVSLWDALILQSARRTGCSILWTEDLNAGQSFSGLVVRNPFAPSAS